MSPLNFRFIMLKYLFAFTSIVWVSVVQADDSFYCPQNHAYIEVGMSRAQVLAACGEPTSRKTGANTVIQQIPVVQLIYKTLNSGPVDFYPGIDPIYKQWSLPSGSQGISLQVDTINNKVSKISINQEPTNGVNLCSGGVFQIGSDISDVIAACGSPDAVNNTYINQSVPKEEQPENWSYDNLPYQNGVTLTFINDALQSIQ
jgi:hypothetical protein